MTQLRLAPTQTLLWANLVQDASQKASVALSEIQESYIVFMLMRFITKCDLFDKTLALAYLESTLETYRMREVMLSETADTALLLAGLFPERAKKLNVMSSYFVDMSRLCFLDLAALCKRLKHEGEAQMYEEVGSKVELLAYVLSHTRQIDLPRLAFANRYSKGRLH
jgi:hypothetical protein